MDCLGEIPAHWAVERLKYSISRIEQGWSPQCEADPAGEDEWGVLKVGCVNRDTFDPNEQKALPPGFSPLPHYEIRPGDILMSRGNTGELVGMATCVKQVRPRLLLSDLLYRFRAKAERAEGDFLGLYLRSPNIRFQIQRDATGTSASMKKIGQGTIRDLVICLPPLVEQRAINLFVLTEVAKIDSLVNAQRQLMDLVTERLSALALSSMRSSKPYELRLEQAASTISRPVNQAEGISYTPLGLFNRGRGLFHKAPGQMGQMGDSDFFWIEEGDLVISGQFAWEGAVALAGQKDTGCVVSHRFPVLRGKTGVARTEYLLALLSTNHGDFLLNEHSRGAAGRNRPLSIDSLLKEKIPIVDPETQERIAEEVHSRSRLFGEIAKHVDLLSERRAALIAAAVTGQIDIRGLAESDVA